MRAWVNGQLLTDASAPALSVTDHGVTVGDGVFEALKVLDGRAFAVTRHLERLQRSAAGLGLPEPDLEAVRRGIGAVLDGVHLVAVGAEGQALHVPVAQGPDPSSGVVPGIRERVVRQPVPGDRVHPQDLAGLATVLAAGEDDLVSGADLHSHYSTSGARETIFMKLRSRSSRATGPKMRVPRGLLAASMITAAFSSKAM